MTMAEQLEQKGLKKGLAKGMEKGRKQGRQEGRQEGILLGEQKGILKVARNMLASGLDFKTVQ